MDSKRIAAFTFPLVLAASTAVSFATVGVLPVRASPDPRPNVLIIITDDQRATDTMEVLRNTRLAFKNGGTYFPEAVATTPACCPSRASIYSGRYAHNHFVRGNGMGLNLDHNLTIQRYLQDAGYSTAIFGKYLLSEIVQTDPLVFALTSPPHFHQWGIFDFGYRPVEVNQQGLRQTLDVYSTTYVADQAIRFLEEGEADDDRPWLMFVAPFAPHAYSPPIFEPKYANARTPPFKPNPAVLEQDTSDKPPWAHTFGRATLEQLAEVKADQLKALRSVDDLVRRLFQTMRKLREDRNTLAFFLSDNGNIWGENGLGTKYHPYTYSIRIPMFARWPGHIKAGAVDDRLVANVDLAPTIAQATGITPMLAMDGRSLLDRTWQRDRWLTEFYAPTPFLGIIPITWSSIRTRSLQYIQYYSADDSTVVYREYYDLVSDPWQLTNLLGDQDTSNDPDTTAVSAQLAADRHCAGAACP